jgi:BppU N-terminal domain
MNDLGEFTQGEIPFANLLHTFQDAAGQPIFLGGAQARFCYREQWGTPTTKTATVSNPTAGQVSYTWDGSEFLTPGHYQAELWTGEGVHRVASTLFRWTVRAAVCQPVPPI